MYLTIDDAVFFITVNVEIWNIFNIDYIYSRLFLCQ